MTPTEKALEIYNKHLDAMVTGTTHWTINARKTAILEVEATIEELEFFNHKLTPLLASRIRFWNEVKGLL